jgi:hypothetical protein
MYYPAKQHGIDQRSPSLSEDVKLYTVTSKAVITEFEKRWKNIHNSPQQNNDQNKEDYSPDIMFLAGNGGATLLL